MMDRSQIREQLFMSLNPDDHRYPPIASMILKGRPTLVCNDDAEDVPSTSWYWKDTPPPNVWGITSQELEQRRSWVNYDPAKYVPRLSLKTTEETDRNLTNDTADALAFCCQAFKRTVNWEEFPIPERPTATRALWNIKSGGTDRHQDGLMRFLHDNFPDPTTATIPFSTSVMEKWLKQFDDLDTPGWMSGGRSFMTELFKHWENKDKMATKAKTTKPKKLTLTAARQRIKELDAINAKAHSKVDELQRIASMVAFERDRATSEARTLTSKLDQERLNNANLRGKIEGMMLVLNKIDEVAFKLPAEKAS